VNSCVDEVTSKVGRDDSLMCLAEIIKVGR
jgi:hypothetical protein